MGGGLGVVGRRDQQIAGRRFPPSCGSTGAIHPRFPYLLPFEDCKRRHVCSRRGSVCNGGVVGEASGPAALLGAGADHAGGTCGLEVAETP